MTIKNIIITDKTGLRHHWKLDEYSGEYGYDKIGGRRAKAVNSQWEYESHTKWIVEDTIIFNNPQMIGSSKAKNEITIFGDDMKIYNYETHEFSKKYTDAIIGIDEDTYLYHNEKHNKVYGFASNGGTFFIYDINNNQKESFPIKGPRDQYHTAGRFYDYNTHEFYLFGGYGWYRAKNHIQKYDFENHLWDTLSVWGDEFYPRFNFSLSDGPDSNCIYFFGGSGNKSGMQERGWGRFNDFWKFNRKTMQLQKLKTFESIQNNSHSVLTYSKEIGRFLLSIKPTMSNSLIYILTINPKTLIIENKYTISNTESVSQVNDIAPTISTKTGRLIVVTRKPIPNSSKTLVQTHTINYPPMDPPPISAMESWGRYGFGITALLVSLGIIGFRWKKNGATDPNAHYMPIVTVPSIEENPYMNVNLGIQCFGNFQLYKYGKVLSPDDWVSKKSRLLFIYIILNGENGVPPQRIMEKFWPDSLPKSAANSRYVAMSQIRKMLAPFGGFIKNHDHNIYLDYNDDHFSDYHYFLSVSQKNSHGDPGQMEGALQLYGKGFICDDINEIWMEDIRDDIQNKARHIAEVLSEIYQSSAEWQRLGELGHRVLQWDPLDENGFRWSMVGYLNDNHEAKAKTTFELYSKKYLEELDHPYELDFLDILTKYAKKG
ncbi:MAG: hypothetical protein ISR82_04585 [Candidatus Marinimicrobia bacterium]|nr:hypothetical protein [Candidatus Neomarinimicrobiota bacterium]MBL7010477.1 hypothetical protein [Candidatus Neomarinimicrobiota bacterium]MBL7030964.1 hypothetical protein [Candidatus Neomarinimicrobiota bacterium]